jgi:TniQ
MSQKSEGRGILPSHPHRQRDEMLSSWILRIASGNIVSVLDLCEWLNIDYPYELDSLSLDSPHIDSLAEAFGVQREVIIEALPFGLQKQYCPICLHDSGHYQVSWTCAFYCCCVRHRCFLRDSCPHCGKPIGGAWRRFYWRVSNPTKELQLCVYCERSLLDCEKPELATDHTVKLTEILDLLVRNPDCDGFFDVLDRLLHIMIGRSDFAFQLRSRLLPNFLIESWSRGATLGDFGSLRVKSRALMLQAVVSLFAHWPDNLVEVLRMSPRYIYHVASTQRTYADLVLPNNTGLPDWYANALRYRDLPRWCLRAIWVAHKRDGEPKKSDRAAFLRAARREGWISVVQFADSSAECFPKVTTAARQSL